MPAQESFTLLRTLLRTLGLSAEAIDDIVARIADFLGGRDQKGAPIEYPYVKRDDFLSLAEQSFYLVLRAAVADWATICPKIGLAELFYAKSSDPSIFRTATNRIDRKHVDFLLCVPETMKPLMGIELDDRSHQRPDRQERDDFVERVFAAARLPLVRLPVRRAYPVAELRTLLRDQLGQNDVPVAPAGAGSPAASTSPELTRASASVIPPVQTAPEPAAQPRCPECNAPMVLRTAARGSNQGGKFWGCPNYPRCRGIVKYETCS